ncbi:MAG: acyl carrier protein [Oscillospiraceae bacterium]|jgi:Acyl carrier protein|nr:acyl carrier protein [Oscillospiraceae bacterium]
MYEKICEILLNYVEEPETGLTPETTFIEDLGMSSLDVMTMVGDLEDEFGVEIETADLRSIFTLQDLVDYLSGKV